MRINQGCTQDYTATLLKSVPVAVKSYTAKLSSFAQNPPFMSISDNKLEQKTLPSHEQVHQMNK